MRALDGFPPSRRGVVTIYLACRESIRKLIPAREKLQRTAAIRKLGIRYAAAWIYPDVQSVPKPTVFDTLFDFRFGVEVLHIVRDDPQADIHFRQTVIFQAHGFAKTGEVFCGRTADS